jgi:hypothetical protein
MCKATTTTFATNGKSATQGEYDKYGNRYIWFAMIICGVAAVFPKIDIAKWRARSHRAHL